MAADQAGVRRAVTEGTVLDALAGADGTADPVLPSPPLTVWSDPTADDVSLRRTGGRHTPPPPAPGQLVAGLPPPQIDEAARARAERELAAERAARQRSAGGSPAARPAGRAAARPSTGSGSPVVRTGQPATPFLPARAGGVVRSAGPVLGPAPGTALPTPTSPVATGPAAPWTSGPPSDRRAAARALLAEGRRRARQSGRGSGGQGGNAVGCLVFVIVFGIVLLNAGAGLLRELVDLLQNVFGGR